MEQLGIKPILILTQMVNFAIVYWVLKKWVFGPVILMLEKRRQSIAATEQLRSKLGTELATVDTARNEAVAAGRKEAERLISEASQQGQTLVSELRAEGEAQVARLQQAAEVRLEANLTELRAELKQEVVSVALNTSEAVLAQTLSPEQRSRLTSEAVNAFLKHE